MSMQIYTCSSSLSWTRYCKRCYFRGINLSRLAAQKHIRWFLNLRWADAHLSFLYYACRLVILYCTKLTFDKLNEWYIYKYVCNWAAQKQSKSQTDSSILPICINTHGQYTTPTCPKCAYKISQIFSQVFEFALAEFARNPRKLMYRRREYFHFYSSLGIPLQRFQSGTFVLIRKRRSWISDIFNWYQWLSLCHSDIKYSSLSVIDRFAFEQDFDLNKLHLRQWQCIVQWQI